MLAKLASLQEALFRDQPKFPEVVLLLTLPPELPGAPPPRARVALAVISPRVALLKLELSRTISSSGAPLPPSLGQVLDALDSLPSSLSSVQALRCSEGFAPLLAELAPRLPALTALDLSSAGLAALPEALSAGGYPRLQELVLDGNRLGALPPLGALSALRVLSADGCGLSALPPGLSACTGLEVLSLEGNRIATPIVDLAPLARLHTLRLGGNPLDYLPELSRCAALRTLSLANVRISADAGLAAVAVSDAAGEGDGGSGAGGYLGIGRAARKADWSALFALLFKHSSCQAPLPRPQTPNPSSLIYPNT